MKKSDAKALASATGATLLGGVDGIEEADLGHAESISVRKFGEDELTFVEGGAEAESVTMLVRGGTEHVVDELERALGDALDVVAVALDDGGVVPGAGTTEIVLADAIREHAATIPGRAQLAAKAFAEPSTSSRAPSPRTRDGPHRRAGRPARRERGPCRHRHRGRDGGLADPVEEGIIDPAEVKREAVRSATEAATMIVRIDDVIAARTTERAPPGLLFLSPSLLPLPPSYGPGAASRRSAVTRVTNATAAHATHRESGTPAVREQERRRAEDGATRVEVLVHHGGDAVEQHIAEASAADAGERREDDDAEGRESASHPTSAPVAANAARPTASGSRRVGCESGSPPAYRPTSRATPTPARANGTSPLDASATGIRPTSTSRAMPPPTAVRTPRTETPRRSNSASMPFSVPATANANTPTAFAASKAVVTAAGFQFYRAPRPDAERLVAASAVDREFDVAVASDRDESLPRGDVGVGPGDRRSFTADADRPIVASVEPSPGTFVTTFPKPSTTSASPRAVSSWISGSGNRTSSNESTGSYSSSADRRPPRGRGGGGRRTRPGRERWRSPARSTEISNASTRPSSRGGRQEDAVVGTDEGVVAGPHDEGSSVGADAGVHDDEVDRRRETGEDLAEPEGRRAHVLSGEVVSHVDESGVALAEDDALHRRRVRRAEVGGEGDHARPSPRRLKNSASSLAPPLFTRRRSTRSSLRLVVAPVGVPRPVSCARCRLSRR